VNERHFEWSITPVCRQAGNNPIINEVSIFNDHLKLDN